MSCSTTCITNTEHAGYVKCIAGPQGRQGPRGQTGSVGPIGPTGASGVSPTSNYGSLYSFSGNEININSTFSAITTGWSAGPSQNTTLDVANGIINVANGGDYLVSSDISGYANTSNSPIVISAFINGVESQQLEATTDAQEDASFNIAFTSGITLPASANVDLRVRSVPTRTLTLTHYHLNISSL